MKNKQIEKFANQHLLPSLPGFCVRGSLLYQVPAGSVLRAFLLDSSGFSTTTFHPVVFVQPLYILSDHLTLTPGVRFLGHWEFEAGAEFQLGQRLLKQIHSVGVPFLRAHRTPEDIIRQTKANPAIRVNPRAQQQLAYSLLLLGRNDEGLDSLDKLLSMLDRKSPPWHGDLFSEVSMLKEMLMRNPREVIQTLHAWTEQTRSNLNLPA